MLLTELPAELLQHVLGYVDPPDLAFVPRTCKVLYHAVAGNGPLFKRVYLRHLDAPPPGGDGDGAVMPWEQALKDAFRLEALQSTVRVARAGEEECRDCGGGGGDRGGGTTGQQLAFVHATVTALLRRASSSGDAAEPRPGVPVRPSRNADLLADFFRHPVCQAAFLCRSALFERARGEWVRDCGPGRRLARQQSARLHCLHGAPILTARPDALRKTPRRNMSNFARSKVYDLRQYTEKTMWGPFMDDGSGDVDWEKVEAIMIDLGSNLAKLDPRSPIRNFFCRTPFAGTWPGSYRSVVSSAPLEVGLEDIKRPESLAARDPYGITGTWLRVVCFLDYTDFFAYNFTDSPPAHPDMPRPAVEAHEATRLITMKLTVTRVEPPGPGDGQGQPVVHFEGISRALDHGFDDNANSDIRGAVRLTPEGEVRWTTFSVFNGEERWRSESVQVGGIGSAKGILGNWFDKDFDEQGPAGPTAFWKISDDTSLFMADMRSAPMFRHAPLFGHMVSDSDSEPPSDGEGEDDDSNDEDDEDNNNHDNEYDTEDLIDDLLS
ncbi:hypothetical protein GGR56DRAFT_192501 [Xylariaceae sp. FL0804]|nr:hypothetical protein GGR56DRAFT_192501 [Xylariaceae sp. FL0804]